MPLLGSLSNMFKNGVYNLLGSGIRLCLGVALIPLIIQVLGLKQYGLYSLVNAVIAFATLSEWSISMAVTVFLTRSTAISELERNQLAKSALIIVLSIASVTSFVLYIFLFSLPNLFNQLDKDEIYIFNSCCVIGILLVWLRLIQQFFVGIEQSKECYGPMNTINTSFILFSNIGTLCVAVLCNNLVYIFTYQLILTSIVTLIHAFYCIRYSLIESYFWKTPVNFTHAKDMMQYITKAWVGSFGSVLFSQGDRIVVGNLLGSEMLGIYSAMTTVTSQINIISAVPLQTIVPQLSKTADDINIGIAKSYDVQKIMASYNINLSLALLLGGGMIGFASEILSSLSLAKSQIYLHLNLNDKFITLVFIYTIYSFNAFGYYVLLALKKMSTYLIVQLISGAVTLITITLLSLYYGLTGTILGNSLYTLTFLFTIFAAKNLHIPIKKFILMSLLPLLAFIIFTFAITMQGHFLNRLIITSLFSLYVVRILKYAVKEFKNNKLSFHSL